MKRQAKARRCPNCRTSWHDGCRLNGEPRFSTTCRDAILAYRVLKPQQTRPRQVRPSNIRPEIKTCATRPTRRGRQPKLFELLHYEPTTGFGRRWQPERGTGKFSATLTPVPSRHTQARSSRPLSQTSAAAECATAVRHRRFQANPSSSIPTRSPSSTDPSFSTCCFVLSSCFDSFINAHNKWFVEGLSYVAAARGSGIDVRTWLYL